MRIAAARLAIGQGFTAHPGLDAHGIWAECQQAVINLVGRKDDLLGPDFTHLATGRAAGQAVAIDRQAVLVGRQQGHTGQAHSFLATNVLGRRARASRAVQGLARGLEQHLIAIQHTCHLHLAGQDRGQGAPVVLANDRAIQAQGQDRCQAVKQAMASAQRRGVAVAGVVLFEARHQPSGHIADAGIKRVGVGAPELPDMVARGRKGPGTGLVNKAVSHQGDVASAGTDLLARGDGERAR